MTLETANRLYELRKKHNLSQEELAEKLGVSRQAVSKWERSEASPDTDNLIALAKIYGLSLDELIYGAKENAKEDPQEQSKEEVDEDSNEEGTGDFNNIFINVDRGEKKVHIGPEGILVEDEDGEKVKISFSGIEIEGVDTTENDDDLDDDEDHEKHEISLGKDSKIKIKVHEPPKTRFWLEVPYPILCVIAYLIFGFADICGGWSLSWVIFVTIPIYYTFVEAIYKRRFAHFAYPVLCAFIYLVCGLYFGIWHPSWLIFITIAVYYPIAEALDRKIRKQ